jgi:hypothetical protein
LSGTKKIQIFCHSKPLQGAKECDSDKHRKPESAHDSLAHNPVAKSAARHLRDHEKVTFCVSAEKKTAQFL